MQARPPDASLTTETILSLALVLHCRNSNDERLSGGLPSRYYEMPNRETEAGMFPRPRHTLLESKTTQPTGCVHRGMAG